jgi:hypothetical protein
VWAVFFAAAAITAIPELLFATAGSANEAESFVGWKFGWDNGEENPIWFWFVNTGLFIPLLAVAIGTLASIAFGGKQRQSADEPSVETSDAQRARQLLLFYAPFALCFIVPNLIRLAPWVWDNIKVLLYWYVASIPLVAWLLAQLWQRSKVSLYLVPTLLVALIFSGWLDAWRIATRHPLARDGVGCRPDSLAHGSAGAYYDRAGICHRYGFKRQALVSRIHRTCLVTRNCAV